MNHLSASASDSPSPARVRVRARWLLLTAVLVAAAGSYWHWYVHRETPPAADTARTANATRGPGTGGRRGGGGPTGPVPVAVATVSTQDIRVTEQALGTVTPLVTVTVQTQISGQLAQVGFAEGQSVHKGDFLALIDPRPYQAALAQAQGQLLRDQASLSQARMDLVRYQQLVEKNSISRQQAEDQKWTVQQDEGTVKIDQAEVQDAQINLGFCRIVSPIDGRIGLRLVDAGNFVQLGSNANDLAVITRMQPIGVVFALPEDSLPAVMARMRARAKLQVQAYDRSGTHLLDTGTLAAIDSEIGTSTGTVNLKALFGNTANVLFPNQFVNVVLQVDQLPGATAVPTAAIQRGAAGPYAYLVRDDNTVAMAAIRLGPADGDQTAVLSGLEPGDRVVVDGADKLRDGARVAVRN